MFDSAWYQVVERMDKVLKRRKEAVAHPFYEDIEKCDEEIDDIMGDFYCNYMFEHEEY